MSDTPKTDALMLEVNEGRVYDTYGPIAELARTLESDLAAMTAQRDEAANALGKLADAAEAETDRLNASLLAAEVRALAAEMEGARIGFQLARDEIGDEAGRDAMDRLLALTETELRAAIDASRARA